LDDLQQIFAWISKDNPRAADRVIHRIFDKVECLLTPELTYMGHPGRDPGTRELIEAPYIVVYEVDEEREVAIILSVVHGARDRDER
jgi:toxin ParE1/3/4